MSLCDKCNAIDIRSMIAQAVDEVEKIEPSNLYNPLFERGIRSHKIHDSVLKAKKNMTTCVFCAFIWKTWDERRQQETVSLNPSVHLRVGEDKVVSPTLRLYITWDDSFEKKASIQLEMFSISDGTNAQLLIALGVKMLSTDFVGELEGETNDPLRDVLLREISSNSGSRRNLLLVDKWLKDCLNDHTSCHRTQEMHHKLPTRVIDVGNKTIEPRLLLSTGNKGSWVSLSYCWGGDSSFVLSQETFPALLKGIPIYNFPSTLQDAILLTRALGIKYIWIDALCIFQDSLVDWEAEAPQMSEIYSNSILTIITANSPTVTSGIFHGRAPQWSCQLPWRNTLDTNVSHLSAPSEDLPPTKRERVRQVKAWIIDKMSRNQGNRNSEPKFSPSMEDRGPVLGNRVGIRSPCSDLFRYHDASSPWAARGWTLQEGLLSWRTLTYSPTQMIWNCITCTTLEYGGAFNPETYHYISGQPYFQAYRRELELSQHPQISGTTIQYDPINAGKRYKGWYDIVTNYTQRTLTREADRLPAIGGLAKSIQYLIQDEYCAGLWRNDIICGLAWHSNFSDGPVKEREYSIDHPSWNWMSLGDAVWFVCANNRPESPDTFTELARVDKVEIEYSSSVYGSVKSGKLTISGPCHQTKLVGGKLLNAIPQHWPTFYKLLCETLKVDKEIKSRRASEDDGEYNILQLTRGTDYGGRFMVLLVLESSGSLMEGAAVPNYYRRIGLINLRESYTEEGGEVDAETHRVAILELDKTPWEHVDEILIM